MRRYNRHFCDACGYEIPPNAVHVITKSRLDVWGWYEVLNEWHFCPSCFAKVQIDYPTLEG